ncbi:UNVERIFIED_CONTAM: hypothetical protein FKN15_073879 [Acipenser sinensis]
MEPVTFSPPLYKQRYQFVIDLVKKYKPKKVVDLGCADCTLLWKLKFQTCIEVLAGVDINRTVITDNMYRLSPLPCEYLQPSERPLTIKLYQGSVAEKDPCTLGFDLASCIELIEHLETPVLEKFSEMVFGYMTPAIVIISTPNAEFNRLLPGLNGFRHKDHKFEWTKEEFQNWAQYVCSSYDYTVEFTGVGKGPPGTEDVGFCTQCGVFTRSYESEESLTADSCRDTEHSYKPIYNVVYPNLCDGTILRNTLISEVIYWAESIRKNMVECSQEDETVDNHSYQASSKSVPSVSNISQETCSTEEQVLTDTRGDNEACKEGNTIFIPLAKLFSFSKVQKLCGSLDRLKAILSETSQVELNSDATAMILSAVEDIEEHSEACWDTSCLELGVALAECEEDWDEELCDS